MNLRKSFKVALAKRNKTQKQLAKELKVTESYISQVINNGSVSIGKLAEICEHLNFKVWEFIQMGEG